MLTGHGLGSVPVAWELGCTSLPTACLCARIWAFTDHSSELCVQAKEAGEREDSVVLSTIHRAKGLEWRVVMVMGCTKVCCLPLLLCCWPVCC